MPVPMVSPERRSPRKPSSTKENAPTLAELNNNGSSASFPKALEAKQPKSRVRRGQPNGYHLKDQPRKNSFPTSPSRKHYTPRRRLNGKGAPRGQNSSRVQPRRPKTPQPRRGQRPRTRRSFSGGRRTNGAKGAKREAASSTSSPSSAQAFATVPKPSLCSVEYVALYLEPEATMMLQDFLFTKQMNPYSLYHLNSLPHCTLIFRPSEEEASTFTPGKLVKLKVVGCLKHPLVQAVEVKILNKEIKSENAIPHITTFCCNGIPAHYTLSALQINKIDKIKDGPVLSTVLGKQLRYETFPILGCT